MRTSEGAGTIRVGNLDGSGIAATLFAGEASPCGLTIDAAAGKIYWANFEGRQPPDAGARADPARDRPARDLERVHWQTTYTTATVNDAARFKAKGP